MTEQKTAIAKRDIPMGDSGLKLNSLDDAIRFANGIVESGLAPKGDTAATVVAKIQAGAELGFPPMRALSALVVVNGRLSLEGATALALIRARGFPVEVCAEGEGDARRGVCRAKRDGTMYEVTFTWAEAKRAGLATKDVYKSYPDDMMIWKAASRMAKRYFSDVTLGLDVAEVVPDYRPAVPQADAPRELPPAPSDPDPIFDAEESARIDAEVVGREAKGLFAE